MKEFDEMKASFDELVVLAEAIENDRVELTDEIADLKAKIDEKNENNAKLHGIITVYMDKINKLPSLVRKLFNI